ncbi:MAG: adenine phosphoribosyltransferase [Verrucomicrobiae bacterium]|nr:adenine phosphoribosyltransferase [Verrucomicrobiae bacterium]
MIEASSSAASDRIKKAIRDIPDFPKPGINFKDITTILSDLNLFRLAINTMVEPFGKKKVDYVLGIDARGFIFGGAMAYNLACGFIPARKPGKLPYRSISVQYDLEYGSNTICIHEDAFARGKRILIVDDVLATGGTANAAAELVEKLGGEVVALTFLVELGFLKGREKVHRYPIHSLVTFD